LRAEYKEELEEYKNSASFAAFQEQKQSAPAKAKAKAKKRVIRKVKK